LWWRVVVGVVPDQPVVAQAVLVASVLERDLALQQELITQ
jgi:hypothetical protein